MCGIAGLHVKEPGRVARLGLLADALLLEIEERGRDATGMLCLTDTSVDITKDVVAARKFIARRATFSESVRTILLHTRFATVGSSSDPRNAHPVASGRVAITHNGTIYNDDALFAELKTKRRAQVDSEAIAALLDWAPWDEAHDAAGMIVGGAAVAAVNVDHPTELILFRTSSFPLHYMATNDIIVWASTRKAIENAWRKTYGRTPMGEFHSVGNWEMRRFRAGRLVEAVEIIADADAPQRPAPPAKSDVAHRRAATYTTTATWTPPWEKSAPPVATALDSACDVRWSDDGACEIDDEAWQVDAYNFRYEDEDDLPANRVKSIFEMDDAEWEEFCREEGF